MTTTPTTTPTSDLKKALNYVRGAIDAGQFVPMFKNYVVADGVLQGSDGIVSLNAPVPLDLAVCVDAHRFVRSILACTKDDEVALSLTDTGNLRVKQGTFRAIVPATPNVDEYPWAQPEGEQLGVPNNLLDALRALRPFIGTDATRPWAMGALIRAGKLYATNNITLAEASVGIEKRVWDTLDNVIIPLRAIDELLRINVLPRAMLLDAPHSATFFHSRSWWMKTLLINGEWPAVHTMIREARERAVPVRISDELRDGVTRLLPFAQGASPLYLIKGFLSTSKTSAEGAMLSGFETKDLALSAEAFKLLLAAATHFSIDAYPNPVYFVGKQLTGIAARMAFDSTGPAATQPTK